MTQKNETASNGELNVGYTSVWSEGNVDTEAKLNLFTGEVFDIQVSDEGEEFEHLEYEEITVTHDGQEKTFRIKTDEGGMDYSIDDDDLSEVRSLVGFSHIQAPKP